MLATHEEKTRGRPAVARPALQHAVCLPPLQDQLRGDRAADVQLQQPLRRRARSATGSGSHTAFDPELVLPDAGLRWPPGRSRPGTTPPAARKEAAGGAGPFLAKAGIGWNTPLDSSDETTPTTALRRRQPFSGILTWRRSTPPPAARPEAKAAGDVPRRDGLPRVRRRPAAARSPGGPHAGRAIHEVTAMTVGARQFFAAWRRRARSSRPVASGRGQIDGRCRGQGSQPVAPPPTDRGPLTMTVPNRCPVAPRSSDRPADRARSSRLDFLDGGPGYLTLDRPASTLSGGELQRVRLATGLGAGLVGVCYVLDEPSIGLHPRDNGRLIDTLRKLQARGNTVVVVEHDEAIMRQADCWWTSGRGPGGTAAGWWPQGRPRWSPPDRFADRPLSQRPRADRAARRTPPGRQVPGHHAGRRDDQQSEKCQRAVSALGAGLRHRGERIGQELAAERDARPGAGPPVGRHRPEARAAHQPPRRQPDRQGGRDRSVAHRPHPAEQPGHLYRSVR